MHNEDYYRSDGKKGVPKFSTNGYRLCAIGGAREGESDDDDDDDEEAPTECTEVLSMLCFVNANSRGRPPCSHPTIPLS